MPILLCLSVLLLCYNGPRTFGQHCCNETTLLLNEQKIVSLTKAAVFADEFTLTNKAAFMPPRSGKHTGSLPPDSSSVTQHQTKKMSPTCYKEQQECYYCHKGGHVMTDRYALKRKHSSHKPTKANRFYQVCSSDIPVFGTS